MTDPEKLEKEIEDLIAPDVGGSNPGHMASRIMELQGMRCRCATRKCGTHRCRPSKIELSLIGFLLCYVLYMHSTFIMRQTRLVQEVTAAANSGLVRVVAGAAANQLRVQQEWTVWLAKRKNEWWNAMPRPMQKVRQQSMPVGPVTDAQRQNMGTWSVE